MRSSCCRNSSRMHSYRCQCNSRNSTNFHHHIKTTEFNTISLSRTTNGYLNTKFLTYLNNNNSNG
jgi:hypothetical protein